MLVTTMTEVIDRLWHATRIGVYCQTDRRAIAGHGAGREEVRRGPEPHDEQVGGGRVPIRSVPRRLKSCDLIESGQPFFPRTVPFAWAGPAADILQPARCPQRRRCDSSSHPLRSLRSGFFISRLLPSRFPLSICCSSVTMKAIPFTLPGPVSESIHAGPFAESPTCVHLG